MKDVGIGLIGCGGMGMWVAKLVAEQDPRLQVRGLYDPDKRSVRSASETFAAARVYRDYADLVKAPDIDWVLIASWNCFHAEQTVAAFRAGKHVFCQKPLATRLTDCLAMRRAWQKSGKMFSIGFTLRYSAHYRKIKELIREGRIGRIISMEFNETLDFNHGGYIMGDWRRLRKYAGTHLLEKCCHDIDLANWMTESRAARVASFGGLDFFVPRNRKRAERLGSDAAGRPAYSTWPGLVAKNPFTSRKTIVDNQVAIIEYANGTRATFHTNCNAGLPERRMYILGSEGAIRGDVIAGTIEVRRIGFDSPVEQAAAGVSGGHGGGDPVLAAELAASMLTGAPPAAGLEDGLKSAVACFAIDRALDTGRVVNVAPFWARSGLTGRRR